MRPSRHSVIVGPRTFAAGQDELVVSLLLLASDNLPLLVSVRLVIPVDVVGIGVVLGTVIKVVTSGPDA